jgi:hypothetical protein
MARAGIRAALKAGEGQPVEPAADLRAGHGVLCGDLEQRVGNPGALMNSRTAAKVVATSATRDLGWSRR